MKDIYKSLQNHISQFLKKTKLIFNRLSSTIEYYILHVTSIPAYVRSIADNESSTVPAHLTDLAIWALPAGADGGVHVDGGVETGAVVVVATRSAEQLYTHIPRHVTHHADRILTWSYTRAGLTDK